MGGNNAPTLFSDAADYLSGATLDTALKAVSAKYTNAVLANMTPNDKVFALRLARNDVK